MPISSNPLAPDPVTDLDSPDVFPPIEPQQEDLTRGVPLGEGGDTDDELGEDADDEDLEDEDLDDDESEDEDSVDEEDPL